MRNVEDKVQSLITAGSKTVGASAKGILEFIWSHSAGSSTDESIPETALKVLTDIASRSLSQREEIRIGIAATLAIEKIQKRLDAGEQSRKDGFFRSQQNILRSGAEEIFEGVLLTSKNEHEEKKIKLLANIFANVAFSPKLKANEANHFLQVADNLTYRQICILGLFYRKAEIQRLNLGEDGYRKLQGFPSYETIFILQDIYQLYNLGLLVCRNSASDGYEAMLGWADVAPNRMELTKPAISYYFIMGLDEISLADLEDVAMFLVQ